MSLQFHFTKACTYYNAMIMHNVDVDIVERHLVRAAYSEVRIWITVTV